MGYNHLSTSFKIKGEQFSSIGEKYGNKEYIVKAKNLFYQGCRRSHASQSTDSATMVAEKTFPASFAN